MVIFCIKAVVIQKNDIFFSFRSVVDVMFRRLDQPSSFIIKRNGSVVLF
jgi:hypothetical protein